MKKELFGLMILPLILVIQTCNAQSYSNEAPILPLKNSGSVLFGQDVVINNQPEQNQGNFAMCSAPNGWLYATYTFDSIGFTYFTIMRSKDNGYTWNRLNQHCPLFPGMSTKKLDIMACGNNVSDQRVFVAWMTHNKSEHLDFMSLLCFKAEPFIFEEDKFDLQTQSGHDIALADDHKFPASGTSPGSVAFIYSKTGVKDSIIFCSSSNGGLTFNTRRVVAVTTKRFHKVDLSYGVSLSQNTGRYFATWEEHADSSSNLGHIYTAHTTPNFNSPFSTPVMLDGLDPSLTNNCRNPVIACQAINSDNDSSNISEIVLFEKYNSGSGDYDVSGFYNKKAATSNAFLRLNIAATVNNELQPDIVFNPYDSTFLATYYDSTNQKLPLLNKGFNLNNPDNWNIVLPKYNESNKLSAACPKLTLNEGLNKVCTGWKGNLNSGNGVALFDAAYFPPVGIQDNNARAEITLLTFPNPCTSSVTVSFDLKRTENVTITVYDVVGQPVKILTNQTYPRGQYYLTMDASQLPVGTYFFTFSSENYLASKKLCVMR